MPEIDEIALKKMADFLDLDYEIMVAYWWGVLFSDLDLNQTSQVGIDDLVLTAFAKKCDDPNVYQFNDLDVLTWMEFNKILTPRECKSLYQL